MQSTTGSVGGSQVRVIYHAPGKSFAWLHKDSSFADFQKALRARLNISKNEPLVIKQIDGDYTLDIETEEEYEAFCHFAKSAPQLHISVNGGLRGQSKAGEVVATSSSTAAPTPLPSNPAPRFPAESEDPTLGKRKASQITTDVETVPSVTQKRKKRRKVGPDQPISTANTSTIIAVPPEPGAEQGVVSGDTTRDAAGTTVDADANQSAVPQAQKKKKRKNTGAGQNNSTPADAMERRMGPPLELADAPEPTPPGPPKTKKRKKTVVLDLSTVIQPPPRAQEPPSTSTARPSLPVTEPPPSATKEAAKNPSAKKKSKAPAEPSEPTSIALPVPLSNVVEGPVSSSVTAKPKPSVSKSGLTRPQVYVEIITKKRKTGKTDGSSTAEKESKQQGPLKKPAQPTVGKAKENSKDKLMTGPTKRIGSPNAPNIQEIMDGVIAAAMEDAKKRASISGTTTDVSESFTPPPQNKSESTVRKPRLPDASSLEAASSTTLLDTNAPPSKATGFDSATTRRKLKPRKACTEALTFLRDNSSPTSISSEGYTELLSLFKNGNKPSALLTAPPPNKKVMKKPLHVKTQPEESTSPEGEESDTLKKKPAPVSDPDDELDAFLLALMHPSQKSVLEELPSDSEDEEEEVEREDMEVDVEDDAPKSKGTGQLKDIARAGSSSDDGNDSESVAVDALVKADRIKVNTEMTQVSETQGIVPSSDPEGEGESLSQPTKFTNIPTNVVPPVSSTSDSPERYMTPISNLKSAGRALNFFNEHVLDKPDPIENDTSHARPLNNLPGNTEDPIENTDTTSTPKPKLVQRMKGRDKTASPVVSRKGGAGSKATQSSLTSPSNSMLPPPTPMEDLKSDLTFSQPLDQSTPIPTVSRKRRLTSQTAVPENPAHSTWTTLPQREQSMDDPVMVDELISSPIESATKLPKATPAKKRTPLGSTKRTPLFLPGTSQHPIPSSDLPVAEKSSSEEEEKVIVPPSPRVLRSSTVKNKTTTPYRSLSVLASQRSIFPSTPIEPVGPIPAAKAQTKPGSDDDDDDEEDSGVSNSGSGSPPPSHIPKGRRAGVGNGRLGKKRSQLAIWF
ncbi:hypothetical protein BDM02DRAFT_3182353 [Thelephora ganbajun]|uniref:Uncharacterized protein n=1 Tax=Thelephora ganbajun TaxID=370292 RepID=A0ACB6ZWF2_THEGA|nr:hypothetical protein BDM02DRAFT_3182353 [Thelephora ganbajun]